MLGLLANSGCPSIGVGEVILTHALLKGGPIIYDGTNAGCPDTDQRGVERPLDGDEDGTATCDIGAYEYSVPHCYLPIVLSVQ